MGATMVLNMAVAALSKRILSKCQESCPDQVQVFAQTPYYPGYPYLMALPTARWNSTADPSSPWTIEIVTLVVAQVPHIGCGGRLLTQEAHGVCWSEFCKK